MSLFLRMLRERRETLLKNRRYTIKQIKALGVDIWTSWLLGWHPTAHRDLQSAFFQSLTPAMFGSRVASSRLFSEW